MNVDDFGFFEYNLCQIKKMDGIKIISVSDGHFETCGGNLTDGWFSLSLRNKTISNYFEYYSNKFHDSKFSSSLNYPDIHRHIVNMWTDACNSTTNDDVKKHENRLKKFYDDTIIVCENSRNFTVDGVRIMGR